VREQWSLVRRSCGCAPGEPGETKALWTVVGGLAVGGFGDGYRMDFGSWGEGWVEFGGELVGDVLGDVFSGGVEGIKGRDVVEGVVGKGLADVDQCFFDEVEVAEEAFVIELIAGDGGGCFEVVAMEWFEVAHEDDGVGGAELVGDLGGEGWGHGRRIGNG